MNTIKKIAVTVGMMVVWSITITIAFGASNLLGLLSIVGTGVVVNAILAIYYSCIDRRPNSFQEWLTR
jgi:hypothetical protein